MENLLEPSHILDDAIYDKILAGTKYGLHDYTNELWNYKTRLDYHINQHTDESHPQVPLYEIGAGSFTPIVDILHASSSTLTSLNLDWLITSRVFDVMQDPSLKPLRALREIFRLRFPCLRAFQLRNTVVSECALPQGLYLLDECSTEVSGSEPPGKRNILARLYDKNADIFRSQH